MLEPVLDSSLACRIDPREVLGHMTVRSSIPENPPRKNGDSLFTRGLKQLGPLPQNHSNSLDSCDGWSEPFLAHRSHSSKDECVLLAL